MYCPTVQKPTVERADGTAVNQYALLDQDEYVILEVAWAWIQIVLAVKY